jgi:hypothetical protein
MALTLGLESIELSKLADICAVESFAIETDAILVSISATLLIWLF